MPRLSVHSFNRKDPESKKRKVRKGTHSCWECRRRKIKCNFPDDATICEGCEARGTSCVSQEFTDEQPPMPDRRLAQRLERVENLLQKLVERATPDARTPREKSLASNSSVSEEGEHDVVCPLSTGRPPVLDMLKSLRRGSRTPTTEQSSSSCAPTPASTEEDISVLPAKYAQVSRTLHALFPSQHDIDAITAVASGPQSVLRFFASSRDIVEGRIESLSSVSQIPCITSHPAVLAKRLMQLTNCIQQLQPMSSPRLVSNEPIRKQMVRFVSVISDLVTSNDDLVGSVEGLETLALLVMYHANAGNLRKSWLTIRRTISVAQLMGVDRCSDKPLKSVDPRSHPSTRTKARTFWTRISFYDRYLSLLLGLPASTEDNSFVGTDNHIDETPMERLEKLYTVITGSIIKRNCSKDDSAFSITQSIDCDLEKAARTMSPYFWQPVNPGPFTTSSERVEAISQVILQMHYHNLLILLHLPYMLRDHRERRWDYSKMICMNSSRELLRVFLVFRNLNSTPFACRHTDYGALTASTTLLLGYIDPKLQACDQQTCQRREADRKLIIDVRDRLKDMANNSNDKLSLESSDIISRLLPLTDVELMSRHRTEGSELKLQIPYLGTLSISLDHKGSSTSLYSSNFPLSNFSPTLTPSTADSGFRLDSIEGDSMRVDYKEQGDPMFTLLDSSNISPIQPEALSEQSQYPELATGEDQWAFQEVDSAYFESLFSLTFLESQMNQ
ncbi:hypothetical protein F4810DRAFT_427324 [Camillea tinctor]|nr:hypothetical protein F4810DRAFT_427324 [Camillea tinctor]